MISRVTLILNNSCNTNCHYCYETHECDHKELKLSSIKYFINFIYSNYKFEDNCILEILGGEPSLYSDWRDLIPIINKLKFKKIVVFTNGIKYIPELKYINQTNHDVRIKIAKNNSNLKIVNKYKSDGLNVDEYFIVSKRNINDIPDDCDIVLCEYIGDETIDLDFDDVYNISYKRLMKHNASDLGLLYLSKAVVGDLYFSPRNTCLPYIEEIAIRYDDKIVPCSRCNHMNIGIDLYSDNIFDKIREESAKLVNINTIGISETGEDCFSCPLKYTCHPCLMIKGDTVYNDSGLIHSAKKCQHEKDVCKAQLDALRDYKKIMKGK